jgi:serine/threonine protein kinase
MSHAPDPGETQAHLPGEPEHTCPTSETPNNGGESLLKPGDVIPGYEILDVLGRGGMGVVYRARQTALDRLVAVKTVLLSNLTRADAIARFEKEARTVARFRHPNVVTAFDFGRHDGRLFFVMELLEGETLEEHIARNGPVAEAVAWGLVRQAAAGLAHAAQMGIVHRDVKPANLFLVKPPAGATLPGGLPMIKLTDFGLALLAADAAAAARLTAAGTALGTPLYMAPEQLTGGEIDHRADIYALGATAFHLLDGQPPFDTVTLWQLLADKTKGTLPRIDQLAAKVSPPSVELVAAMMAHDPAARIGSYEELLQRIDLLTLYPESAAALAAAKTLPVPSAPSTKIRPAPRRRRWLVVALVALLALAGAGALAWYEWPRLFHPKPSRPTMVRSDREERLFDGQSLRGWQTLSGLWTPGRDAEKANVLSGRGLIRRPLPPWASYRLTLGLDLHKATSVDVLFGLSGTDREAPAGLVLRVMPQGTFLGRRSEDGGEVRPTTPTRPLSGNADPDGESVYREVRLERQGRTWFVYYDGNPVGTSPAGEAELQEFRLAVAGGEARFDTIEVVELVPPGRE